jgi:hypothetical protein
MYADPIPLGPLSVPGQPTDASPGSEQKVRIMIERASRREPLFHPRDGICQDTRVAPALTPSTWQPSDEPLDDLEKLLETDEAELGLTA